MNLLCVVRYRLRALFRGAQLDRETEQEMRFHIDMVAREYQAAGYTPAEARRRALQDFGGLTRKKEETRGVRGGCAGWRLDCRVTVSHGLVRLRAFSYPSGESGSSRANWRHTRIAATA
jgi:hypothetical protein